MNRGMPAGLVPILFAALMFAVSEFTVSQILKTTSLDVYFWFRIAVGALIAVGLSPFLSLGQLRVDWRSEAKIFIKFRAVAWSSTAIALAYAFKYSENVTYAYALFCLHPVWTSVLVYIFGRWLTKSVSKTESAEADAIWSQRWALVGCYVCLVTGVVVFVTRSSDQLATDPGRVKDGVAYTGYFASFVGGIAFSFTNVLFDKCERLGFSSNTIHLTTYLIGVPFAIIFMIMLYSAGGKVLTRGEIQWAEITRQIGLNNNYNVILQLITPELMLIGVGVLGACANILLAKAMSAKTRLERERLSKENQQRKFEDGQVWALSKGSVAALELLSIPFVAIIEALTFGGELFNLQGVLGMGLIVGMAMCASWLIESGKKEHLLGADGI